MRIAVINSIASVGGSRFDRVILKALRKALPEARLSYFTGYEYFEKENTADELRVLGIDSDSYHRLLSVSHSFRGSSFARQFMDMNRLRRDDGLPAFTARWRFRWKPLSRAYNALRFLRYAFRHRLQVADDIRCIRNFRAGSKYDLTGYDVVLYTWPYSMKCPDIRVPHVAVFHDFNFCNFFGVATCSPDTRRLFLGNLRSYVQRGLGISSTDFMLGEARRFLPEAADRLHRVHVASFSEPSGLSETESREIVDRFDIPGPYIVYPCNQAHHKNVPALLTATYLLRQKGHDIRLILVGHLTEYTEQGKLSYNSAACDRNEKDWHVKGLGYVSNREVEALIKCASIVVSSSLYEAASGPGMDGWAIGTPVAFSNLPFNTEHFDYMKVRAKTFDPKNAHDIAAKLAEILDNPKSAREDAEASRAAINENYPPEKMAEGYLRVMEAAIRRMKGS